MSRMQLVAARPQRKLPMGYRRWGMGDDGTDFSDYGNVDYGDNLTSFPDISSPTIFDTPIAPDINTPTGTMIPVGPIQPGSGDYGSVETPSAQIADLPGLIFTGQLAPPAGSNLSQAQVQQIAAAGGSSTDVQAILAGTVTPTQVLTALKSGLSAALAVQELSSTAPRATPTIAAGYSTTGAGTTSIASALSPLTQATIIPGIPNWMVALLVIGGVAAVASSGGEAMSYAAISTRNEIGVRRKYGLSGQIRFLSGMGALGDGAADALNAGYSQGEISTLQAMGVSDAQLEALASGQIDYASLVAELAGNSPQPGQPVTSAPNYPTPDALQSQSIAQTGYDLTDPASWYDITGQLQQANTQIKTLEQMLIANQSNSALISAIASDVVSMREQYGDAASKWTAVYVAAMGQSPGGLSGYGAKRRTITAIGALGIAPLVLTAAIIGAVVVVLAALYTINNMINSANAKAAAATQTAAVQTTSATQQSLLNSYNQTLAQAQQAAAGGNTALASQLTAAAAQLAAQLKNAGYNPPAGAGSTIANWFTANWGWVAAAVIVVQLGPGLIKKVL